MKPYAGAFLRAVLAGTITASALPFLFAVVILMLSLVTGEQNQALATLYIFLLIVGAIAGVIGGVMLLIGLPLSFLVNRLWRNSHRVHVILGVLLGFVSLPAFLAVTGGQDAEPFLLLIYTYSALAGGVTADTWWRNTSGLHPEKVTPA